jgi:hypothetical protein
MSSWLAAHRCAGPPAGLSSRGFLMGIRSEQACMMPVKYVSVVRCIEYIYRGFCCWSVVTNIVCVDDVAAGEIHILSTQKIDSVVILVRQ